MHYNYLKKRNILLFMSINEDVKEEIQQVENELYIRNKPKVYGELLMKMEKNFELNCITLQQSGIHQPRKASVQEFYTSINLLNKQQTDGKRKRNSRT